MRGLHHGTVLIRFRSRGTNAPGLLLGARKAGAALGAVPGKELDRVPDVASFFVKKDGGVVRYALPQGQAESALGAGRDQWHMAAFSSTDAKTMRLTVDGREVFSTTNTAFDGLLNALTGINEVSIGGYREADGAVRHGFTGEISDVLVTSQAVSDEDAKTITLAGARSDGPGGARAELFNDSPDSTWAFTGAPTSPTASRRREGSAITSASSRSTSVGTGPRAGTRSTRCSATQSTWPAPARSCPTSWPTSTPVSRP